MEEACRLIADLGFDGIDINMGCPDKSIEKQGSGASMIKNPKLAKEIILAAKRGVKDKQIPVTVKTRVGYNRDELDSWISNILEASPAVITVHARTRKEMSKVPANWDYVKRAVEIRNKVQSELIASGTKHTLIFGNGDVVSISDAYKKYKDSSCDGVMIGRAIFGNPWLFYPIHQSTSENYNPTIEEKLNVMVEHTYKFERELGGIKSFDLMKKHYKAYVNGFDGAKELRVSLMDARSAKEVEDIVKSFLVRI